MIYKENPIEMKNSAYWFKCTFVSYYLHRNSIEKRKIRPSARPHNNNIQIFIVQETQNYLLTVSIVVEHTKLSFDTSLVQVIHTL